MLRLTIKQIEILKLVKLKQVSGDYHDVYSLMDSLSYKPKRDALLHSIRLLINEGYIEKLPKVTKGGKSIRPFAISLEGSKLV